MIDYDELKAYLERGERTPMPPTMDIRANALRPNVVNMGDDIEPGELIQDAPNEAWYMRRGYHTKWSLPPNFPTSKEYFDVCRRLGLSPSLSNKPLELAKAMAALPIANATETRERCPNHVAGNEYDYGCSGMEPKACAHVQIISVKPVPGFVRCNQQGWVTHPPATIERETEECKVCKGVRLLGRDIPETCQTCHGQGRVPKRERRYAPGEPCVCSAKACDVCHSHKDTFCLWVHPDPYCPWCDGTGTIGEPETAMGHIEQKISEYVLGSEQPAT